MKEDWPQNVWTENWKMQGGRLVGKKVSIRVLKLILIAVPGQEEVSMVKVKWLKEQVVEMKPQSEYWKQSLKS